MASLADLQYVVEGQSQRNVREKSKSNYLSKMKVMTEILYKNQYLWDTVFDLDPMTNLPRKHSGLANKIYKLAMPMSVQAGRCLFGLISIDDKLPKKRKIDAVTEDIQANANIGTLEEEEVEAISIHPAVSSSLPSAVTIDPRHPAKNKRTVSAQTYQNYKSALKWWHEFDSVDMDKVGHIFPAETDKAINTCIKSYKRDVGEKKRAGIMKMKEGKSKYNLQGYKTICKYFMGMKPTAHQYTWAEAMFADLFTKLSVNTIGRSDNAADILLGNMGVDKDAATVGFASSKSDQTGEIFTELKHIYANPRNPEICCILSLAVYTFCKRRLPNSTTLFDGNNQNKRYYHILMDALKNIPAEFDLGCARDDIGTHSNRKFAESTAASKPDGPAPSQVCLRANQSIGKTQNSYMFQEDDGDAFVGRTVALQIFGVEEGEEFDILPAHFSPETMMT